MHMWHCDITYDITAPFNDITLENKMTRFGRGASEVRPPKNCLKTAVEQENCGHSTPRAPGVLHNATPSPVYLGMSLRLEPTTTLFIIIFTSFVAKSSYEKL